MIYTFSLGFYLNPADFRIVEISLWWSERPVLKMSGSLNRFYYEIVGFNFHIVYPWNRNMKLEVILSSWVKKKSIKIWSKWRHVRSLLLISFIMAFVDQNVKLGLCHLPFAKSNVVSFQLSHWVHSDKIFFFYKVT